MPQQPNAAGPGFRTSPKRIHRDNLPTTVGGGVGLMQMLLPSTLESAMGRALASHGSRGQLSPVLGTPTRDMRSC